MVGARGRVRVRFVDDDAPEDPWGPEDEQSTMQGTAVATQQPSRQLEPTRGQRSVTQTSSASIRQSAALIFSHDGNHKRITTSTATSSSASQQPNQQLSSLQQLCLGTLGRHVSQLVEQMGGYLSFLPADAKAALLACARRRGELTGTILTALADMEWTQLDLSWCDQLYAAEVIHTAPQLPNIQVLDVTGFKQLVSGGWKQFARAWPNLSVIRLGGDPACTKEALKALPHILPGIAPPTAAAAAARIVRHSSDGVHSSSTGAGCQPDSAANATTAAGPGVSSHLEHDAGLDSWEDALEDDAEQASTNLSDHSALHNAGNHQRPQELSNGQTPKQPAAAAAASQVVDCRLKHLRALIWPDVPQEAVRLVQQRCPKVLINPPMKRDRVTGQLPPRELDGSVALDQPYVELLGPEAMRDLQLDSQQQEDSQHVVHIADKFRAAYIQQAARLKEKERRMRQQEQKRQLKASHALRTLNAWLDEPA